MATATTQKLPVEPKVVHFNPSAKQLKEWALAMPNARKTDFGAPNVQTKVLSRSKLSTYIVTDDTSKHSDRCMTTADGKKWAKLQDDYIKQHEMIVVDGYIGNHPKHRTATRLIIEKANANIAGMQQQLYYPISEAEKANFEPTLTVIYTPNLVAAGCPDDRLIAVYLDQGITRVFNSDYFGESKKGGLRMWNKLIYDKGGLPMHAGAKLIPVGGKKKGVLIVGLSGTGKTTTTFTNQNGSNPIQDDFIAWMPDGSVVASENGCFAKTFGL
ncbi:MAG: phosphoenolpyruvate carboxykinase (ATP), partial [Planctomycetes bacterium]|nr:phosphoenolpyruvate carboxykinase (ATP) [Planctomycetota bacterium]